MLWRVSWIDGEAYVQAASKGGAKVFAAGKFSTRGALRAEQVLEPATGAQVHKAVFTLPETEPYKRPKGQVPADAQPTRWCK